MPYVIRDPYAPISPAQESFLRNLLNDRACPSEARDSLVIRLDSGEVTKGQANDAITWLKGQPYATTTVTPTGSIARTPVTEAGIYEANGEIYQVKWNKTKTNMYAKKLTMSIGEALRLTAAGTMVKAAYEYAPGAFRMISAEDRITGARAEELSIVFTSCIVCTRTLKAASSVKAGIGPVCAKKV